MPDPETDLESSGTDADILGFDADGPVDILEGLEESADGDSSETTEEEPEEQLAEGEEPEGSAAEGVAEQDDEEPDGDVTADHEEVTPGGFTWLGKTYKDQDEAEHAERSYEGTVNSWKQKYDQAQQETDQIKALYDEATQRVETPKVEPAEAEGDGAPPTDSKAFKKISEVVNPNMLEEITEKLGQAEAYKYMLEQFDKVQEHNLGVVNDERLSVIETEREEAKEFNAIVEVFSDFAGDTVDGTPNGAPKYPEMRNDEAFIGRVSDRYLKTPGLRDEGKYGVYLAYLAEKDWQKYEKETATPPVEVKPSEVINGNKPTQEPIVEDQALIPGPGPSPTGGPLETEEGRIRQQLDDAKRGFQDDTLGYDA